MNPNSRQPWHTTACILCECNCGIEVQLGGEDGRRFVRFRGDKSHPASRGYACEKPHRLDFYQNHGDRITQPLRRRDDGSFEPVDWATAIAEISARLTRIRDQHGGESIFYYGGGGQGNHLPGAYASATRRALGSRYRSNALAQEKTGMFWVSSRMLGGFTRSDFESCEVALFIGKNPWHSHSIPRARVVLKEIAGNPDRTLIVIDPRRSETAAMADIHLQVKPGTDAWLLAAMDAILIRDELLDREFLAAHTDGLEPVIEALRAIPIADYCDRAGIPEAEVSAAVKRIAGARSVASMEDLGVQMNRHSTLVSYLHRLLWLLTGNFGRPGSQYIPTTVVDIAGGAPRARERLSPVAKAPIIGGMVPCNVIAEEILSDHPDRYRAMIIEAANPVHSLADSPRFREALGALDTVVVIDVAMTETAREADYVLPASTQYEKAEATFFNFEFPHNYFHLRHPLLAPPDGPLSEAEIHARIIEAMGLLGDEDLAPLRAAAADSRERYVQAFFAHVMPDKRRSMLAPVILYRTLGPTLPAGLAEAAVLLGAVLQTAMQNPASLARAGFDGPPMLAALALFDAILQNPHGLIFAVDEWGDLLRRVRTSNGRIQLELPEMLAELGRLDERIPRTSDEFPFILSAGERRSFTANTIVRDPRWRKKDREGALRVHPDDATRLGVQTGDRVRLTTKRGSVEVAVEISEMMQAGHVSLPNGLGLGYRDDGDNIRITGVAPNELTSAEDRDPFAGTPWHKYVPARIARLSSEIP